MAETSMTDRQNRRARRTALACVGIAAGMVGAAYASVPLYDLFCRMTGFGGTPIVGTAPAGKILDQTMTVRFDGNVMPGLDWRFSPEAPAVTARIGETQTVYYKVRNASDAPRTGIATYNVNPPLAGAYFVKLECFCFTEQTLAEGQNLESAVVFYIDPGIVDDPNLKDVKTITLSYTYFPVKDGKRVTTSALTSDTPKM